MERTVSENQIRTEEREFITEPPFYSPAFEASFRYIIDDYEVEPRNIAIFMPCAMRKPYSSSPSHRIFRRIIADVFEPSQYHIVIFGTCGVVPAELEEMYPYAHYRYMLGKEEDESVRADFLRIETERVAEYLRKTRDKYRYRLGYCIGMFRETLVQGSVISGVPIDILCPSRDLINTIIAEEDCPFQEGSLSMDEYLDEFHQGLCTLRDALAMD